MQEALSAELLKKYEFETIPNELSIMITDPLLTEMIVEKLLFSIRRKGVFEIEIKKHPEKLKFLKTELFIEKYKVSEAEI